MSTRASCLGDLRVQALSHWRWDHYAVVAWSNVMFGHRLQRPWLFELHQESVQLPGEGTFLLWGVVLALQVAKDLVGLGILQEGLDLWPNNVLQGDTLGKLDF